ncbi:MAG TPA: aldehyde dehydrogenase family protein, partial [Kiritimatiellia bacterium]|nr:aldehyde dehydrogenase family protein [Kiritimatiellia bacterium]
VCVGESSIESAGQLMKHPGIRVLVVTGGGGVIKAAMASGKRALCAGPGNPPVVVDETADIEKAASDIVYGASFDNNMICVEEKETVVVASVADKLIQAMLRNNAVLIDKSKIAAMEQTIFTKMAGPRGHAEINRKWIGQNADKILAAMGISAPATTRLAIVELPEDHPLFWTEQMMPVMPICRVPNVDYAIDIALQMEGHNYHTALMHSRNIDKLSKMARQCNCSIFVKNGRSQAGLGFGGEGYTSFTIASPTGEGLTTPRSFSRLLTRLGDSLATQKRFLADAAHQLKTPLAGLRMQADLAQREGTSTDELKQSLKQIGRSSIRATHTVNQLLALARAEAS